MEKKKWQKTSAAALLISLLPFASFLPVLLGITLTDEVRLVWACCNILCVLAGLSLSFVCVTNRTRISAVSILSTVISGFLFLLTGGVAALALLLCFVS